MDVYVAGAFRIPVAGTLAATGAIIGPCASSNVAGPVRPEDHYAIQPLDRVDVDELLALIRAKQYFVLHAEHWLGHLGAYREAVPQLILQSYLQRVVNGGGRIEREYGLGRGRTDLLVLWPRESGQPSDLWDRFVVECKVLRDSDRKSLEWTVGEAAPPSDTGRLTSPPPRPPTSPPPAASKTAGESRRSNPAFRAAGGVSEWYGQPRSTDRAPPMSMGGFG